MTTYNQISNIDKTSTKPVLSVLIPFYNDNPAELLEALIAQCNDSLVEILLYDDGTNGNFLRRISTAGFADGLSHEEVIGLKIGEEVVGHEIKKVRELRHIYGHQGRRRRFLRRSLRLRHRG